MMRIQVLNRNLLLTALVSFTLPLLLVTSSPTSSEGQSQSSPLQQLENHHHQHHSSDGCDWEGSGLRQESERVVVPVYLRCSHGSIKWHYPRGALRVVLRHGTSSKDFRGCIRVANNISSVRMYIEGHRKLHNLYSHDDGKHPDLLRCFVSNHGQIALYIEAEPPNIDDLRHEIVAFSYALNSVSSQSALLNDYEECRPCDDHEMHTSFCTSDFIIQGTIMSLNHNKDLERTELHVKMTRVFKDPMDKAFVLKSGNFSSHDLFTSEYGIEKYFTLHRPLKCGTKAGTGTEFLFLGRWILGNPVIVCAPKVTYWKHVKSKAIDTGANQCELR